MFRWVGDFAHIVLDILKVVVMFQSYAVRDRPTRKPYAAGLKVSIGRQICLISHVTILILLSMNLTPGALQAACAASSRSAQLWATPVNFTVPRST